MPLHHITEDIDVHAVVILTLNTLPKMMHYSSSIQILIQLRQSGHATPVSKVDFKGD